MTREDCARLAAALASTRPDLKVPTGFDDAASGEAGIWLETREAIAYVLASDNPRFDRGRFLVATEA